MNEINEKKITPTFATNLDGKIILINKAILFEIIEYRIKHFKVRIKDLFMICPAPNGEEGEDLVETPYGKLRVFFIRDLKKVWVLHRSKFKYPQISKVKGKVN